MTKIIKHIEDSSGDKWHLKNSDHVVVEDGYQHHVHYEFLMDADTIMELELGARLVVTEGLIDNQGQIINEGHIFNTA